MAREDATPPTTLDAVAASMARSLSTLAEEALRLSDQAAALLRRDEQERRRVQQFIDHFALGSRLADRNGRRGADPAAALEIDHDAVRRDVASLDQAVHRVQSLHGRLLASHRLMRELGASFAEGTWDAEIDAIGDDLVQQATVAAREDERGRLAREIHDGPAQILTNVVFALELAEQVARCDPDRVPGEFRQLRSLLKGGIAEMRRFMIDLRPAMLADQGLVPALDRYIEEFNGFFDQNVAFLADGVPATLSSEQQLALFRVVQEGLQNVQKHARADAARVELGRDGRTLVLTIADQGTGFDPAQMELEAGQGAGLPGMRERARLIGADFAVTSSPGTGTVIRVALPLAPLTPLTAATTSNGSHP